ncbi:MAG: DUF4422 domain-containing protein [Acidaminococcus provencensis]|jgi:hypothetical protein|uniref:DUF4422 domain-containing protein n=1 Tax=Acidaminococcus provencensis TaxID=2058289 RepID=UPI0023F19A82|nr:DUF4422 domain-containing protein [Acidaminococcus provencensis]MCH4095030.1 DUF4422 domain-containing protein [Acidaminococcus provencensis]
MDIKILVAAHKAYWMPENPVYPPLQVGAEGKPKLGYTPDNTGDNISAKNPCFCELTGLYWAWKNLDCEYIGLCHYRRYFGKTIHTDDIEKKKQAIFHQKDYERLLQQYDVILPEKRHYYIETVRSQYEHAHYKKDLDLAERLVGELYPEYSKAFTQVMNRRSLHILNMFVMKKSLFDAYCQWLFPILFAMEKQVDITGYSPYEQRLYGFLSERLFNVWLEKQQLKTCEVPVVFLEKIDWVKKGTAFLQRKFRKR